jgi:hypothetical protein
MAKQNAAYVAVNAGEIGPEVMARTSLETYQHTASLLENWLPEVAGPMMFRPGLAFLAEHDKFTWLRRFTFNPEQAYLMCLSDKELRVASADGRLVTRSVVACAIPDFTSLDGWIQTVVGTVDAPTGEGSGGTGGTGTGTGGDTDNTTNDPANDAADNASADAAADAADGSAGAGDSSSDSGGDS